MGDDFIEDFIKRQVSLHNRMASYANENFDRLEYFGSIRNASPIYDGVIKPSEYFRSKLRILWILKEPRDKEKNDRYCGGGWQMFADCDDANFNSKIASQKTIFRVAQISYAVENGISNEEAINLDASAVNVLRRIAYINIGKMPGPGKTDAKRVKQLYKFWKSFVLEQISMCNPELIICAGSGIMSNLSSDLGIETLLKPAKSYVGGCSGVKPFVVDCYRWNNVPIVSTAHPTVRANMLDYFKCTLDACNGAFKGDW